MKKFFEKFFEFFRLLRDLPQWTSAVSETLLEHEEKIKKLSGRLMPNEAYLESMPQTDVCIHCLQSKREYCHDGYGRTVCKACKPLQYHNESVAGRAKGWQ